MAWLRTAWQATQPLFRPAVTTGNRRSSLLSAGIEERLRTNERIWFRFSRLELEMLDAGSLEEVIEVLAYRLPASFPAVHAVSLVWQESEGDLLREIQQALAGTASATIVPWPGPLPLGPGESPRLGPLEPGLMRRLFPSAQMPLQSAALVPMRLHGRVVGTFNQASTASRHFTPESSTELVEHLAAVAALCIENSANRARLQRDSLTDALTGAPNRRFFERRLREEISIWQRHGTGVCCLLVDLDHFKQINDRYGHSAGDEVLQQVTARLGAGLRTSDVLARFGGEEFVLLLPAADQFRAREIAERLRDAIGRESICLSTGERLQVTVSIGLSCLDTARRRLPPDEPAQWLIQTADEALYRAKACGRNCVQEGGEGFPQVPAQ